jgi:dipeptidyl aminopeptidase/acylaminoacyl peptidase
LWPARGPEIPEVNWPALRRFLQARPFLFLRTANCHLEQNPFPQYEFALPHCTGFTHTIDGLMNTTEPTHYQRPPETVLSLLHTPPVPSISISPNRQFFLMGERLSYPSISEMAIPVLKLAGLRINPANRGPWQQPRITGLRLREFPAGPEFAIELPPDIRIGLIGWSPDSRYYAFTVFRSDGIEPWILDTRDAAARPLGNNTRLNMTYGVPAQWTSDSRALLVQLPAFHEHQKPIAPLAPFGPVAEETSGKSGPVRTWTDLLRSSYDESLFEFYCTSQLALISVNTGQSMLIGSPAIFSDIDPSPEGDHILVVRHEKPWSFSLPCGRFPRRMEVWNHAGNIVHTLAVRPLEDRIPIEGVPEGPRSAGWHPAAPATLVWLEALDGGDPNRKAEFRDVLMAHAAPFTSSAVAMIRSRHRCMGVHWGETEDLALLKEFDRDRRWTTTWRFDPTKPDTNPQLLWDLSVNDRYGDPGSPLLKLLLNGRRVLRLHDDCLFMEGHGATPHGDRPFLNRFSLRTGETQSLFNCDDSSMESVVALLDEDGSRFLTQIETPTIPPNYRIRSLTDEPQAVTTFSDPVPHLRNVHREIVSYQRSDGVTLSFTLYLPHNAIPGKPLPTLLWAYPREFNDPETAGQISGSTKRFTSFLGASHLFLLTQGYAILDNATMPVVGAPDVANDTFISQIVDSAHAAIRKATDMGVTDPERVAVGGHSYGAFMAVNLLAHSELFRAGIARSGAYNRTLTPFGFQNERRTFWEAPDVYMQLSPFASAHKIKSPLLLIHGEEDNNPGTFPMQSERLYQAIRGNGGTVRYVSLPHESHSYTARESVEHTLWEMIQWMNKHVATT